MKQDLPNKLSVCGTKENMGKRLGDAMMELSIMGEITETDISEQLGVSRQWVSQVFNNGASTIKSLMKLADALGFSVTITFKPKERKYASLRTPSQKSSQKMAAVRPRHP